MVCGVSASGQPAPDELRDHVLRASDDAHVLPTACGSACGVPTPAGHPAPAAAAAAATDVRGGPQAGQGYVPQHGGPGHQVGLRGQPRQQGHHHQLPARHEFRVMLTCLHALNGCVRAHTQGKDRTASFPAGKRDFIPYGVCSNVTSKIGLSMIVIITEHSLLKWLQHWEMKVDTTDSKPYHSCDIAPVTANGGGGGVISASSFIQDASW